MREIKFRVWDEELKRYWFGWCLTVQQALFFGNPRYIVEQYIGLEDMSGEDIYEGAILQWDSVSGYENGIASVEWVSDHSAFYLVNDALDIYDTIYDFTPFLEIIGNIHENPDLLDRVQE